MRKKANVCDVVFNDFEGNVKGYFSSEHIVKCFKSETYEKYKEVLNNNNIKTIFKDKEIVRTIKIFFDNNLNISQTSKVGFMHRNTLIYRLEKIKKLTGLNLKNFEDAVIFVNLQTIREYFNYSSSQIFS